MCCVTLSDHQYPCKTQQRVGNHLTSPLSLLQTMAKTLSNSNPPRQIRCTVGKIPPYPRLSPTPLPPSPLSKPCCDWRPFSSLIVAAYRAGRGAAGVVYCGRQPWDNSCTGGRKRQQSEQEKFTQGETRWGLTSHCRWHFFRLLVSDMWAAHVPR